MAKYIHIRLRRKTATRLRKLGRKGETYDDIISRLIEEAGKREG